MNTSPKVFQNSALTLLTLSSSLHAIAAEGNVLFLDLFRNSTSNGLESLLTVRPSVFSQDFSRDASPSRSKGPVVDLEQRHLAEHAK